MNEYKYRISKLYGDWDAVKAELGARADDLDEHRLLTLVDCEVDCCDDPDCKYRVAMMLIAGEPIDDDKGPDDPPPSGFHVVNRAGYYIIDPPWENGDAADGNIADEIVRFSHLTATELLSGEAHETQGRLNFADETTTGQLDRTERDEMRRLNPEIDELLCERSYEADNADYQFGDANHRAHGDYMDELQDRLSDIVGEENFDAFWQDWEEDEAQAATIFVKWREFKGTLLRPCCASESVPEPEGLTPYNCFQELMQRHEWPDWPTLAYFRRTMEEYERQSAARKE